MASEWQQIPLEDGMEALIDYRGKTPTKTYAGVPLITAKVVKNGRIETPNEFISPDDYDAWMRRGIPQAGDVLITTEAPLGEVAQLGHEKVALAQRLIALRGKLDTLDNTFLKFLLQSDLIQNQLRARASGSTVSGIKQSELRKINLSLPPMTEQRAIAHILGTLDDKIELNRRRNQTLEAMARALFKDWFVDFGPVRAKMEARDAYLPADLWQHFPDRLDDEGKPEGWIQQRVGDIGRIVCGKTPPTKNLEYYGDDVPFITIPEMHGNIFATNVKKRLSHKGAESQEKKTLPPGSICVSCIATLGLVVITTEPSQTNQQINSVIPAQGGETYFWYWALKNLGEEIKAGGSGGSVLGNLSTARFSELRVDASSGPLRLAYDKRAKHLFSQILQNERQSQSLAQLRDTLLPKLISGKLRVKDAELFIERAN